MQKEIEQRNLKERIQERRKKDKVRLTSKTEATKNREKINKMIKKAIDFEHVIG